MRLFDTISNLSQYESTILQRRFGVIETHIGKLTRVHIRPWPKLLPTPDAHWLSSWQSARRQKDQCLLYYNQVIGHTAFLDLKYIVTSFGTRFSTLRRALQALDIVAQIKKSDAIVTEVFNDRIGDRLLERMGWESHLPRSRKRHFIKRFYGEYPSHEIEISKPIASKKG